MIHIRALDPKDHNALIPLIARFRVALANLKGQDKSIDLAQAGQELQDYLKHSYPIFIAVEDDKLVGYLVCRVDADVVWAESLFVLPAYRRAGVASQLYAQAEQLAEKLGSGTVYNWVHPTNDAIIRFLEKRGYDVLNLIELRRKRPDEETRQTIQVGKHKFNYGSP